MQNKHEPRNEFVERMEWQIGREVRRRNRSVHPPRSMQLPRIKTILGGLVLMLVSMAVGAAVVAAAYQAESGERRDLLISNYERRAELARQRLAAAREQLQRTEQTVALGVSDPGTLAEGRFKVADAQAQLRSVELQLEEIRVTGLEPLNEASSPLVRGRDFVAERLRVGMSVPEAALEPARSQLRRAETLRSVGTADELAVDVARARVVEVEAAIQAFRTKLEIRQNFSSNKIDAVEAELRVLESDANQRQKTLTAKLEQARKQLERATRLAQIGVAQRVDLAEATLRLQELETEIARAELDLELVRRRLGERRGER